jgi:hypothetical protein
MLGWVVGIYGLNAELFWDGHNVEVWGLITRLA